MEIICTQVSRCLGCMYVCMYVCMNANRMHHRYLELSMYVCVYVCMCVEYVLRYPLIKL
jgi:hypothetical protein